jgi:hypothetical protein
MAISPVQLPINNPQLFINMATVNDIRNRKYRWLDQPLWPAKNVYFTTTDRTNRRALIQALLDFGATNDHLVLGLQLLECANDNRCGSPLCNFCRTRFQDAFEKRVSKYFGNANQPDLFFVTLLDDLTYDPVTDAHEQIEKLRTSMRGCLMRHFPKQVRAFGAFEVDVKDPNLNIQNSQAVALLQNYGFQQNAGMAFMPHLHAIIELDGITVADFRKKLRSVYTKPKQVTVTINPDFHSSTIHTSTSRSTGKVK